MGRQKKKSLSESAKKRKFVTVKNLLSNNVEWNSRNLWKTISADAKAPS